MKGLIALDIDGTVTDRLYEIDTVVLSYLKSLYEDDWQIFFVTGRTFSFSKRILQSVPFPFFGSVQNGSAIIKFPEKQIFHTCYLDKKISFPILKFLSDEKISFVVECGFNVSDICYYFPTQITKEELEYIKYRISISPETWIPLDSIDEIPEETFPVIKYFSKYQNNARQLAEQIESFKLPVKVIVISDPFNKGSFLAHITAEEATKRHAVEKLCSQFGDHSPVIVAGDDFNDREMLERGTVKIVMSTAPQEILEIADIIAPPAGEKGIIQGLEEAVKRVLAK